MSIPEFRKNFQNLGFFFITKTLSTRFATKHLPQKHLGLKLFGAFLNRIQTSLYLHPDESCDATHQVGFRDDFSDPNLWSSWEKKKQIGSGLFLKDHGRSWNTKSGGDWM